MESVIKDQYIAWVIMFIFIYASFRLFRSQSGLFKFFAGILLFAVSLSAFRMANREINIIWLLALTLAYRQEFIEWYWATAEFIQSAFYSIRNGYFAVSDFFSGLFPEKQEAPETDNSYQEQQSYSNTASEEVKKAQREARKARQEAQRAKQDARRAREQAQKAESQAQANYSQNSPPPDNRTNHDKLEVKPGATKEEIRKSYKKLEQKYHPDRNPEHLKKAVEVEFKIIQKAYKIIG